MCVYVFIVCICIYTDIYEEEEGRRKHSKEEVKMLIVDMNEFLFVMV